MATSLPVATNLAHCGNDEDPSTGDVDTRCRRSTVDWAQYKGLLRFLYIEKGRTLPEIMDAMLRQQPPLKASERQYKEKFREWKFKKNLSREDVAFMLHKIRHRTRNEQKGTVFRYCGVTCEAERVERIAKRSKIEESVEYDMATPPGMTYHTPTTDRFSPAMSSEQPPYSEAEVNISATCSPSPSQEISAASVSKAWRSTSSHGLSKEQLDSILRGGVTLHEADDILSAEHHYEVALQGYIEVLGEIHEETRDVVLRLAKCLIAQDRDEDAHALLNKSIESHVKELGIDHQVCWQHVVHIVQMLGDSIDDIWATADFLAGVKDIVDGARMSQRKSFQLAGWFDLAEAQERRPQFARLRLSNLDLLKAVSVLRLDPTAETPTAEDFDTGLKFAQNFIHQGDVVVEVLLHTIIESCYVCSESLTKQKLNSWSELLNFYHRHVTSATCTFSSKRIRDSVDYASSAFEEVLTEQLWPEEEVETIEIMEALARLLVAIRKAGDLKYKTHSAVKELVPHLHTSILFLKDAIRWY